MCLKTIVFTLHLNRLQKLKRFPPRNRQLKPQPFTMIRHNERHHMLTEINLDSFQLAVIVQRCIAFLPVCFKILCQTVNRLIRQISGRARISLQYISEVLISALAGTQRCGIAYHLFDRRTAESALKIIGHFSCRNFADFITADYRFHFLSLIT